MRVYNGGDELWRDRAACSLLDVVTAMRYFYPPGNSEKYHNDIEAGRSICSNQCPVRTECLEYALRTSEDHGTWGGATQWERITLRGKYARGEITIESASGHGTEAMATKCKLGKNGKMCKACRSYYDRFLRPQIYKRCLGCGIRFNTSNQEQRYHDSECSRKNGTRIAAEAKRAEKAKRKEMANA